MKTVFAPAAIGFGLLLFALSFLWPNIFDGRASWTDEKAGRRTEVQNRLHYLGFVVNAPAGRPVVNTHAPADLQKPQSMRDLAPLKEEYDKLQIESQALNAEFETAANRPKLIASILKWAGVSVACVGIIGWFATKQ